MVSFASALFRTIDPNEVRSRPRDQLSRFDVEVGTGNNDVLLPWGRHRTGRMADECEPMSFYRIAEMGIALSSALTFALVGWWEIVAEISSALE